MCNCEYSTIYKGQINFSSCYFTRSFSRIFLRFLKGTERYHIFYNFLCQNSMHLSTWDTRSTKFNIKLLSFGKIMICLFVLRPIMPPLFMNTLKTFTPYYYERYRETPNFILVLPKITLQLIFLSTLQFIHYR